MKPQSKLAVKMAAGTDDVIEGLGIPFGGYFNGKDVEGEYFTKSTDLALEWFAPGDRPALYHHGLDKDAGMSVVGRVQDYKSTDLGVWTKVQLDRGSEYFDAITELVGAGKLFFSSGSMAHLAKRKKSGEITTWPWVELSLTPTPANPLAELDFATAEKHFEVAGIKSARLELLKATDTIKALPDSVSVDGDGPYGGGAPEGSYEDLMGDLNTLLRSAFRDEDYDPYGDYSGPYAYVVATFPEYCIACVSNREDMDYYQVAYTIGDDQEPVLGEMRKVERVYQPLAIPMTDEAPLAIQSARLSEYAALVLGRTKDVHDRRIKEGRILSSANRDRLATTADSLEGALKALRDLLHATEPQPAKAASVNRDRDRDIEMLRLYAASF